MKHPVHSEHLKGIPKLPAKFDTALASGPRTPQEAAELTAAIDTLKKMIRDAKEGTVTTAADELAVEYRGKLPPRMCFISLVKCPACGETHVGLAVTVDRRAVCPWTERQLRIVER